MRIRDNLAKYLTKRVTFSKEGNTSDGMGGWTPGWTEVATVWAEVTPLRADEIGFGEGQAHEIFHRITVRYNATLQDPTLQASMDGRNFAIEGVRNVEERNRYLEFVARELES